MRFGTFTATTVLAIAAIGFASGTADAKPIPDTRENTRSGVENEVGYQIVFAGLDRKVTTSVDGGKFEAVADTDKVLLRSDSGNIIAEVPLNFEISGKRLELAEQISDNGEKLILTPRMAAKEIGEMRPIGSMDRLIAELDKNMVGVIVGGILGGILGAAVGMMFFSIITGPVGLLVGAIAGGYIIGGEPFMGAVTAVLTGQP